MGTAANKELKPIRQLPTLDPLRRPNQPEQSPAMHSSSPTSPQERRRNHSAEKPDLPWPLPPTHFEERFQPSWPSSADRYSLERACRMKLTHSNEKPNPTAIKVEEHREFHQKETGSTHWKKDHSSIHESAHVQSSLQTQSHSCINLSTKEEVDRLLLTLNKIHSQTDRNVEQARKIISSEAKEMVNTIVNDTRRVQQTLLEFAKHRQTKQEQLYNEWLQLYVVQLDTWKSACLAELQDELQEHQKVIMLHSQQLMTLVNDEANRLRDEILRVEQTKAVSLVQDVTDKIQSMSTHHLGTETMTKINLIIHGNVGTKAPGQCCTFGFTPNNDSDDKQNGRTNTVRNNKP